MRNLVHVAQTDLETFDQKRNIQPLSVIYNPKIRNEVTCENGKSVSEVTSEDVRDCDVVPLYMRSNLHLVGSVVKPRKAKAYCNS